MATTQSLNFTLITEAMATTKPAQCYDFNRDIFWIVPLPYRIAGLFFGFVIFIFGITGNFLLVLSYMKCKYIRTPFNTLLLSMSFNDIAYLTFVLPLLMYVYIKGQWTPLAGMDIDVLCVYNNVVLVHCEMTAFLYVLLVAFYRYATVVHPLGRIRRLIRSCRCVIVMIILGNLGVLCLWAVPRSYNYTMFDTIKGTGLLYSTQFDTRCMMCVTPCLQQQTSLYAGVTFSSLTCTVAFMYARVAMVKRQRRLLRTLRGNTHYSNHERAQRKEIKFIILFSLLIGFCIVCYTGYVLIAIIDHKKSFSHLVYFPFVILNWLPAACNWLIYTAMAKNFKKTYKTTISMCR